MSSQLSRRTLLAGVGVLGLAACSNEGRGGPTGGSGNAAGVRPAYQRYTGVKPDFAGAEYNIPDAFNRYPADPVQAITQPPGDGRPISITTYTNTPIPPKLEQNRFWQELNRRVGSPVTVSLTPSVDYNQKFATVVAGDRLSDIFMVGAVPQVPQLLGAKAADLTAHLSGDNIKKYPYLANLPETAWNNCIYGNKIYGVPIPRGAISSQALYSRADLLEKQGLNAGIKSADDFIELCKQLTDKRRNRFALATSPTQYVRNMFDMPNNWREDGSTLVHYYEHESHEAAFEVLRKLWSAGYVHPDAFSGQNQDMKVRFGSGTSALVQDTFSGWPSYLQTAVDKDARIGIIAPPKHDGSGTGKIWLGAPAIGFVAINKKAESRVETLLAYLNFLAAPFGTQEYLFRKFGLPGLHHQVVDGNPVLTQKGFSEVQLGLMYQADGPWTIFLPEKAGNAEAEFNAMKQTCPTALADPAAGLYSETNVRKGPQLNEDMTQLTNDIIQGRKPVSAWAGAVKKWKSGGGDKIAEEFAQALEASR
ncbi:extracellular solute-binding protein [Kribbella sandramycini]|uniref:Extracellular solute-binding protein n=1 Tax=Kribbella sandramycini TaxID=60450 RepID=A0A7Y4L976_9ACTN|nr:extracellular solute-binding protein [Kribbella sandramycini]MBB6570189.1 putative aldouronate transport system substrate-binding protein [Kribbella sandramycini]NOL45686.1 extracellular solute-binding protein [Kribbella sandramycini]